MLQNTTIARKIVDVDIRRTKKSSWTGGKEKPEFVKKETETKKVMNQEGKAVKSMHNFLCQKSRS
mgnify:CR=1 FL=1